MIVIRPCRVLFLLAWLLVAAAAHAQERQRLTLAAYNIENLVDVFDDPYYEDEQTKLKPHEDIRAVAEVIRAIDADVMALVEVENEGVLRAMVHDFLGDMGYEHVVAGMTNDGRGMRTGVVSRLPILSVTSYRFLVLTLPGHDKSWKFARDLLHVKLQATPRRTLDVFVVHFKSRRFSSGDPNSSNWRLAEATAARRIIGRLLAEDPQAWIAMMGDFNDTPQTTTITSLLSPYDNGLSLTDVHASLAAEQRITYRIKPYRSTIDYILASPDLARRLVPGSAKLFDDEAMMSGSDHAPLIAAFDIRGQ